MKKKYIYQITFEYLILKAHNGMKVLIEYAKVIYVKFNFVFSMDFRIEFYNSKQTIFRRIALRRGWRFKLSSMLLLNTYMIQFEKTKLTFECPSSRKSLHLVMCHSKLNVFETFANFIDHFDRYLNKIDLNRSSIYIYI